MLLSFAIARDVAAPDAYLETSGKLDFRQRRTTRVHLFNEGGAAVINNTEKGELKGFIESAYPKIKADSDWWLKTLDFFVQARTTRFLEIRSALFNVLLDRISATLPENRSGDEIDQQLRPQKSEPGAQNIPTLKLLLKDNNFRQEVTRVFHKSLPTWTDILTERYITSHLKTCNSRPSFPEGIRRVCRKYGVPAPPSAFLRIRHKLLHQGDLDPENGEVVDYVRKLDALVSRLILRMLGYSGHYFDVDRRERLLI